MTSPHGLINIRAELVSSKASVAKMELRLTTANIGDKGGLHLN
jgi:hypothetical protein